MRLNFVPDYQITPKENTVYQVQRNGNMACRAGTTTRFHFGDKITTDLANYAPRDSSGSEEIYREKTTPCRKFWHR